MAKSIIPPAPRGLNLIAEYTLSYELPSDLHLFQKKRTRNTKKPASAATTTALYFNYDHHVIVPYTHDYYFGMHPEYFNANMIRRQPSNSKQQRKCLQRKFYDYNRKYSNICLSRAKRKEEWRINELTVSQRMFYDLIEKWSLL